MVSHRSLSDSKCPQVSRTFLGIMANLNNDDLNLSSYFHVF